MSASKPPAPQAPQEDSLDEALEETFPASDPIAIDPSPSTPPPLPADEHRKHGETHRHGKH
ncbi:hypothetical protein [Paraburkholderia acidisoli]|uniref:Uncharacterized protein n=1 Tax=Paraburkholderia acidisoli TaxID=2571748 RepID=A0A7Z2GHU4_9BURK|nr:hypothetical protein [Paraburkholderia acidisoli]QGZ61690.1 hypothetical protein FAZ98_08050 [Paraburkholderia acidisoli]